METVGYSHMFDHLLRACTLGTLNAESADITLSTHTVKTSQYCANVSEAIRS